MNSALETVQSSQEKRKLLFLLLYHHSALSLSYEYSQDKKKPKVKSPLKLPFPEAIFVHENHILKGIQNQFFQRYHQKLCCHNQVEPKTD